MIIALTGHRGEGCRSRKDVWERVCESISSAPEEVEAVICGMAAGFDLWLADEALDLGLPVIAAKPWAGHQPRKQDAELYAEVIAYASRVVNVDDAEEYPGPWAYQRRNEWMVDNSTHVMAYWNGTQKGGTYNCVKYANGKKPVRNIYG